MGFFASLFKSKRKIPFEIYDDVLTADPDYYGDLSFSDLADKEVQLIKRLNLHIEDFFQRQIMYILENEKKSAELERDPIYAIACFFEVSMLSYRQITWILAKYKIDEKVEKALYDCLFYTFRAHKIFKREYSDWNVAFKDRLNIYQYILISIINPKSDSTSLSDKLYNVMIKSPAQSYKETIDWNFIDSQVKKGKYWQYLIDSFGKLTGDTETIVVIKNY